MNTRTIHFLFGTTIALAIAVCLFVFPMPAQAATPYVITTCTELALVDAMNYMNNNNITDGIISFNCNNVHAAATISIGYAGGYIVASGAAYTIDGGSVITLTGLDANRLLQVQANAALTLTNLTLTSGNAGADYGGCLYNSTGHLRLDNVTLQYCRTANSYLGGAIENNHGTLMVVGSRILSSTATSGGGIDSFGTLTILSSTLAYNTATTGAGGALEVVGSATIDNSQIYGNRANGGDGGGLYAASASNVTIQNSLLASNVTTNTQFASGGGLYSLGSVTVTNSTLSGNLARYGGGMDSEGTALLNNASLSGNQATTTGGGIFNAGRTTLNNSTLSNNSADLSGGGIDNNGTLTLNHSTLGGNKAYASGGGIYNEPGKTATLNNSTLSGNTGWHLGGGIYNEGTVAINNSTLSGNAADEPDQGQGGGIYNGGTVTLQNSTLSGNAATIWGGALYNLGTVSVSNSTLSGNSAGTHGGGIYNAGNATLSSVTLNNHTPLSGTAHNLYLSIGVITLTHTIVNFDVGYGANCFGASYPHLVSLGHNLANDSYCSLTGTGDQQGPFVPILLGPLANHGGTRLTQLPRPGSAAIDSGDNTVCAALPVNNLDQRGVLRPLDGNGDGIAVCDIGAVERQPSDSDLVPWLYLPLIKR